MSSSQYSKQLGQFEALEAKQMFAADLAGGAVADLAAPGPDTAIVAEIDAVYKGQVSHINGLSQYNELDFSHNPEWLAVEDLDQCNELELAQNLGGQEGEDIARQLTSNLSKGAPWAEHNMSGTTIGGQEGEPLHTAAHEAAHVVRRLGGQEGEPIIEERGPEASIAPDGCVDLIKDRINDSSENNVVAEVDTGLRTHSLFGASGASLIINDQHETQLSGVDPIFEQYAKDEFFIPSGSTAELQARFIG